MNRRILLILALLSAHSSVFALETQTGDFKLEIFESQGRFAVYALGGGSPEALFVAQDPATSYLSLLLDNRIYRLGDSFEFRQSAEVDNSGGRIVWTSPRMSITASIDISHATYAAVDILLENTSETELDVGLRLLLDTYLGEDAVHFVLPTGEVTNERDIEESVAWVQSGSPDGNSLYLLFSSFRATPPDRIILANWKRLDDTSWTYTVNTNRNFSVIPYSINDSAVAAYYDPTAIASGEARSIRLILATALPQTSSNTSSSTRQSSADGGATRSSAETDAKLIAIETLINRIDAILDTGEEPTEEQLKELTEAVRALKGSASSSGD